MTHSTEHPLKIALVASSGGHLTQLLKLRGAWEGYDAFYVVTTDVVQKKLGADKRIYVVGECNREHPLRVVRSFWSCLGAMRRERPAVVLSTGAAIGCLCCFIGRLFGAKVIWVDSITNVEHMSLSGRMVRHIADLCVVQWPDLTAKYPRTEYLGNIL